MLTGTFSGSGEILFKGELKDRLESALSAPGAPAIPGKGPLQRRFACLRRGGAGELLQDKRAPKRQRKIGRQVQIREPFSDPQKPAHMFLLISSLSICWPLRCACICCQLCALPPASAGRAPALHPKKLKLGGFSGTSEGLPDPKFQRALQTRPEQYHAEARIQRLAPL